jgi:hypothetical protein
MGTELDRDVRPAEGVRMTERTQLRRLPKRGSHDSAVVYEILDSAFLAQVGFAMQGSPL